MKEGWANEKEIPDFEIYDFSTPKTFLCTLKHGD